MINPIVQSCLEIARAGYERRDVVDMMVDSPRLKNLGNFLLNNSKIDHTFRLQQTQKSAVKCMDTVAIAYGAGIDSRCALHFALKNELKVHLVHVNYGQPYHQAEFEATLALVQDEKHSEVDFHFEQVKLISSEDLKGDFAWKNYIIPARNLVLAAIASQYSSRVWVVATHRGVDESVGAADKSARFFQETGEVLTGFYGYKISVSSPFFKLTKKKTAKDFLQTGGTEEELKATFSCYSPVPEDHPTDVDKVVYKHCGTCYACYKRHQLFQALDIEYNFVTHPQQGKNWLDFQDQEKMKGR